MHEELYKIYVTDALQIISENTARYSGGKSMSKRYWDFMNTADNEPQRTSEDIIESIGNDLDLLGKEENDERIQS